MPLRKLFSMLYWSRRLLGVIINYLQYPETQMNMIERKMTIYGYGCMDKYKKDHSLLLLLLPLLLLLTLILYIKNTNLEKTSNTSVTWKFYYDFTPDTSPHFPLFYFLLFYCPYSSYNTSCLPPFDRGKNTLLQSKDDNT